MSDIEKTTGGLPATDQANPFEAYGNAASARGGIEGKLLKFNKGDYLVGQEGEEVPLGTQFEARVDKLMIGWVRWEDNRPVDKQHIGLVAENYQPPRRSELGDLDRTNWEYNDRDEAQDPWQFTNYLPMIRVDSGDVYTFVTPSKGGLGAIGELAKEYGKEMRLRPDQIPLIELDVGSYQHPDRSIGRVKYPIFKIIGWVPKDGDNAPGEPSDPTPPPPWSSPPDTPETAKPETTKTKATTAKAATAKSTTTKPAATAQRRI